MNKKIVSIGLSAGLLLSSLTPMVAKAATYYKYTVTPTTTYTVTTKVNVSNGTVSRTYTKYAGVSLQDLLKNYDWKTNTGTTGNTGTTTQPTQPTQPAQPTNPSNSNQGQTQNPGSQAVDTERQYELEVIRLVNIERQKEGLQPLKENPELSRIAKIKSQEMKDKGYFSHTSPTYGSPFDMMKSFGITYTAAGENIARGQKTPAAVVQGWMNSSGHRRNIMNPNFTEIGIGCVTGGNGPYWTQMFIRPR